MWKTGKPLTPETKMRGRPPHYARQNERGSSLLRGRGFFLAPGSYVQNPLYMYTIFGSGHGVGVHLGGPKMTRFALTF